MKGHRGPLVLAGHPGYLTIHPSFLLRMPPEDRADAWRQFVSDMKKIQKLAQREKEAA